MTYDQIITIILVLSVTGYLAGGGLLIMKRQRAGAALGICGWVGNAAIVILNWMVAGHPPFGNMYHVLVFVSLCFLPAWLILAWKEDLGWTAPYFAVMSALPLFGPIFMERDLAWQRPPALQSAWFVPHVVSYMVSYALAAVAFALTVTGVICNLFGRSPDGEAEHMFEPAGHQTLRLAFPFMTFGLLSGALWAEEAWGVYWSWDPKETWSLITWTLYIIFFHCRLRPDLRRFAPVAHMLAFAALLTTFFLVNLLPKLASALHSYT